MARIRTIKPEFWTSEQIVECSTSARLLFVGMWNFCDDSGVHPANLMRLKMEVFPADGFQAEQLGDMVKELLKAKLITVYRVNDQEYWRVTGWKHQKIDRPGYKYPLEDGRVPDSAIIRRDIAKRSSKTRRALVEDSPPEGKVREGKVSNKTLPAAKTAADARFDPTRKFIERCCEHAKVPFLWGPGEAKQLSDWLKQAPGVDQEAVIQLVKNRFRSNEPPGKRPRIWIAHLSSYADGPVDRFGKTSVKAEDKLPNVNEIREQQRKEAIAAGG